MKRRVAIFGGAFALYAALIAIVWSIGTYSAEIKTEAQLDYAVQNLHNTVCGAVDTMLGHVARTAVRHIGHAHPMSRERMIAGAKELDIDEVNIVDRTGRIIASNDPHCMNVIMAGDPVMDEFMALTNGLTVTVSQPFRPHARNPKFRAKYLAAAFPGGDGFVQVGLDERRFAKMLPNILGYIFDEWLLGRTGFFLCADGNTGRLVSNPVRHRDEAASLAEAGYDAAAAREHEFVSDGKNIGKTFAQQLFGEVCYCRAFIFCGHRFVAALPMREHYDTRFVLITVFGSILLVVLTAFAMFLDRIFRDADRLKAFYRAEELRQAKDMETAASIQDSAIPCTFPPFPNERRMDIFAQMETARDVGGDFYDFYFSSQKKITFLIADVSGKGVPAALFMMRAKASIKGIAQTGRPLADVVTEANDALSRDNGANMFVTAWIGELDLETGVVAYVNAGHNPPIAITDAPGAENRRTRYLRSKPGLVLGMMPGVKYHSETLALSPGDALYLYTDGLTEQPDSRNELFGEERLENAVAGMLANGTPLFEGPRSRLLGAVMAYVRAHGLGVAQSDDCTQLIIRYNGDRRSRSFPPTQAGIAAASAFLDECFGSRHVGFQTSLPSLHVILDEICSNIVNYSGASGFDVHVDPTSDPAGVKMTFIDDGKPYDPLKHEDPDVTLSAVERDIGGLGLFMVKKMSSSVSYCRDGNRNRLVVQYVNRK